MENTSIAVLLACYNRRQHTLASLAAVFNQQLPENVKLSVYLLDDASTDGTVEAVSETYPEVKIIRGDGSLFWNGGMRVAFAEAIKSDPDYYLWLNDDTILYPDTVGKLLATSRQFSDRGNTLAAFVGATQDPDTGELTYGGQKRSSWWHPLKFKVVLPPEKEPLSCDTMNGNCVLLPRSVVQLIGNLDSAFIHSKGDWDYGLRLTKNGGSVWLLPGYIGTCKEHPIAGNCWDDPNLTWGQRVKIILNPKDLPIREWRIFSQRYAGVFWPFYWVLPYIRLLLKSVYFTVQKTLFWDKNSPKSTQP